VAAGLLGPLDGRLGDAETPGVSTPALLPPTQHSSAAPDATPQL